MKNRLLTMAGGLALIAVLGKYYAVPAIAQSVRAAVVKNVDEKGRIPFYATSSCNSSPCTAFFPVVPANRRLVIEYVNAFLSATAPNPSANLGLSGPRFYNLPLFPEGGGAFGISTNVLIYAEPGSDIGFNSSNCTGFVSISGYLVDLSQ